MGGFLSIGQMFVLAYNENDWSSIFGDPTKFGLGLFSVLFDILLSYLFKQKIKRLHEFSSKKVSEYIGALSGYFDLEDTNRTENWESTYVYKEHDS